MIGMAGKAALSFLDQDNKTKNEYERMAAMNAYELEKLKLQASLRSTGGSGGGSGRPDETAHNAGIKALADKYPSDPNFKRS